MINVLLVDDHTSFRNALAFMLDREDGIRVVGQAGSIASAEGILETEPVDVALVDLDLAGENGADLIRSLRVHHPHAAAVVLTGSNRSENSSMAISAGAVGLLHKSCSIAEVASAIRKVGNGQPLISPADAVALFREAADRQARTEDGKRALQELTPREADVLRALAAGLDNQAIAERLYISHETVRSHVARILRKLGVESRLQAVLFALRYGFLHPDELG